MPARHRFRLPRAVAFAATAAALAGPFLALPAAADGPRTPEAVPGISTSRAPATPADRIIVKFRASMRGKFAERGKAYGLAAQEAGVSVKELRATAGGARVLEAPAGTSAGKIDELAAALAAQPNVEYAEPDTFIRVASTPNDPLYPEQWDLFEETGGIRAPAAWDINSGHGAIVAVIDTGITIHSDLTEVLPGYDFISDLPTSNDGNGRDPDATDPGDYCASPVSPSSWHGTHVAGSIGAAANNGFGIAGVAYSSKILPVRAIGACGGYLSDIVDGIVWAAGGTVPEVPANPNPAKVINMSLAGTEQCSVLLQSALDFAAGQGAVVVAAAGNENSPASGSTPANCNNVITVGATGREGSRAFYSNFGPEVDVSAPGGDSSTGGANTILSTWNQGTSVRGRETYAYMQGTSMAAPHVAGIAALIMSANPSLTPAQVEAVLKQTARPLPGSCDTGGCGAGLVDAAAAVQAASVLPGAVPYVMAGEPKISGTAAVGHMLTASTGTWSPDGVVLKYQWRRSGVAIPGATVKTYTAAAGDADVLLSVTVTGSAEGYNPGAATSGPVRVARGTLSGPIPMISGTRKVGYTLTAAPGTWTSGTFLKYQWYRSGLPISGATGSKYTLAAADQGKIMRLRVGGIKAGYTTIVRDSATTSAIAAGTLASTRPWISGAARYGYTLTANAGTWTAGTAFRYQWYRSGGAINGATGRSYRVVWADRFDVMSVRVVGSKAGYTSLARTSGYSARVP